MTACVFFTRTSFLIPQFSTASHILVMSNRNSSDDHPQSWEGSRLQPSNAEELEDVLGRACDYRGDVTIHLKAGEPVIGYVFDRQQKIPHQSIKVFLANKIEPCIIKYKDIAGVEFSGEDTAFGRSWDDWAKKWQKPKEE